MHLNNIFEPIFLVILVILIKVPRSFSIDDEKYQACTTSYQCVDTNISYPFWGGNRPEYCGYPGFELDCNKDVPEITTADTVYRVLDINTATQNLTLSRLDYWNDYCPTYLRNSSIDFTLFNYTNSTNITIFYDCPTIASDVAVTGLSSFFTCNINGSNIKGYYVTESSALEQIGSSLWSCEYEVLVPVFQSAADSITDNATSDSLITAVNGGFGSIWSANESTCETCTVSGGACGQDSGKFVCYCPDGEAYISSCGGIKANIGDEKSKTGLTIGLAVAGAAVVGIFFGFLFFCIRRRRRHTIANSINKDLLAPPSSKTLLTRTADFSRKITTQPPKKIDLEVASIYFGTQIFDYAELEEATDNFSKELGEGGFGVVYYGKLNDGRVVAVKRLYEQNFRTAEQFVNEVQILSRMRHKNLVALHGCTSRKSQRLILVYEYIPNGTVADHIHNKSSNSCFLAWPVRLSIAIETADALAYLHASEIIHRDVKTNNILLDNDYCVKVADFGLSRLFPTDVTHVSTAPQGTPGYVDPEYYQCYQLTTKSDVYSFGVVLMELLSSKEAVDTTRHRQDINLSNMAITKIQNGSLHEFVDPLLGFETDRSVRWMATRVAELGFRCLQQDKDMRPTMQEVLETLKKIEREGQISVKADVVDIEAGEVISLKNSPIPVSPNSVGTPQWTSFSTTPTISSA